MDATPTTYPFDDTDAHWHSYFFARANLPETLIEQGAELMNGVNVALPFCDALGNSHYMDANGNSQRYQIEKVAPYHLFKHAHYFDPHTRSNMKFKVRVGQRNVLMTHPAYRPDPDNEDIWIVKGLTRVNALIP